MKLKPYQQQVKEKIWMAPTGELFLENQGWMPGAKEDQIGPKYRNLYSPPADNSKAEKFFSLCGFECLGEL